MERITIIDDVVKVHLITNVRGDVLENKLNEFLVANKIEPQRLVDIKLTETESSYTAMVIYKTTIKTTK